MTQPPNLTATKNICKCGHDIMAHTYMDIKPECVDCVCNMFEPQQPPLTAEHTTHKLVSNGTTGTRTDTNLQAFWEGNILEIKKGFMSLLLSESQAEDLSDWIKQDKYLSLLTAKKQEIEEGCGIDGLICLNPVGVESQWAKCGIPSKCCQLIFFCKMCESNLKLIDELIKTTEENKNVKR